MIRAVWANPVPLPPARSEDRHRVCHTASGAGAAEARCLCRTRVTPPPCACAQTPATAHPPGAFYKPVDLSVSDSSQHKPAADCPEQTPLPRKLLSFVSVSPLQNTSGFILSHDLCALRGESPSSLVS